MSSSEMIPRVAVVATHNRPRELARLLAAIAPQCHAVFVVDNASTPPVRLPDPWLDAPAREDPAAPGTYLSMRVHVIRDEEQPPNLSRLWNVGLDAAHDYVRGGDYVGHDVAIFNDDAVVPPGWWDAVSEAMRARHAAAACSDPHSQDWGFQVKVQPDGDIMGRMCGWAFMLRGELGMRLDERFRWWWGDSDLDWRARRAGGMVVVPGFPVGNTLANSTTVGVLAEQAGRDREAFIDVWGYAPW